MLRSHRFNPVSPLFIAAVAAMATLAGCDAPPQHLQRGHGIRYYETGQYDLADDRLSDIVEKDNTDWKAMYYLGLVRLEQDRALDAELILERAHRIRHDGPETADILDALAEAMYRQSDNTTRLTAMLDGATRTYGTTRDYTRQGKYLGLSGDPDGAQLAFEKAFLSAGTGNPAPYVAAADFYESIGDIPRAKTALRQAYWITPNNPALNDRLRQHGIIPGPTAGVRPPGDDGLQ